MLDGATRGSQAQPRPPGKLAVTLLLNSREAWSRRGTGTHSLRAMITRSIRTASHIHTPREALTNFLNATARDPLAAIRRCPASHPPTSL